MQLFRVLGQKVVLGCELETYIIMRYINIMIINDNLSCIYYDLCIIGDI